MIGFESTIQKILFGAAMYVCLTSMAIFVHWMWFSNYDMAIGRKMKKNALKPGERVLMKGLALPSSYYEEQKKKEEEKRKNEEERKKQDEEDRKQEEEEKKKALENAKKEEENKRKEDEKIIKKP